MTGTHLKNLWLAVALATASLGAQAETTPIYGRQLMTQQERIEYRDRLRAAKTAEERAEIRQQHHEAMQVRARERGVTLPETPPERTVGKGMQLGPGGGMGPGGGPGPNR